VLEIHQSRELCVVAFGGAHVCGSCTACAGLWAPPFLQAAAHLFPGNVLFLACESSGTALATHTSR
jgi:hypothetical protein